MLQRKQTLWLLLALTCSCLTFFFPFYSGDKYVREHIVPNGVFLGDTTFFVFVTTLFTLLLSAFAIGLFKKRKMQFWITLLSLVLSVLTIVFYFRGIKTNFQGGHILLTSIFSFAIPVFLFFALRGIRHDEKLVKSLDKLR
ncbi:MAG: DUF4293 family protein [Bacteroidetes bacterium]|nr:DUF4293 family protein [Bacteroidota bacterium]